MDSKLLNQEIVNQIIELGATDKVITDEVISNVVLKNKDTILNLDKLLIEKLLLTLGSNIYSGSSANQPYNSLVLIDVLLDIGIDVNSEINGMKLLEYFFNNWEHETWGPNYSDLLEFNSNDDYIGYYHELINVLFRNHPNLDFWDEYDHDFIDLNNEIDDDDDEEDEEEGWDDEENWNEVKKLRKIKQPFIVNYFKNFIHKEKNANDFNPNIIVTIEPQGYLSVIEVEIEKSQKIVLSMGEKLNIGQKIDVIVNNKVIYDANVVSEPKIISAKEYQDIVKSKKNIIYISKNTWLMFKVKI